MIYIPIMKNRQYESRFIEKHNKLFTDSIVPLVEVITDIYETKYEIDSRTGEYVYEKKPGAKRRSRVKLPSTDNDIITIDELMKMMKGKRFFVDYFRFATDEYAGRIDYEKITLALKNSRSFKDYKMRLISLIDYEQVLPVLSIKKGVSFDKAELISIIKIFKENNRGVGIRITYDKFEEYSNVLGDILDSNDYILYDIREESSEALFMELEDLEEFDTSAKKILLNSPRKRSLRNTAYEIEGITELIDNQVVSNYIAYNFDGFGDFGGLKDVLPTVGGSNGTGAALGLLYDYKVNGFRVYKNEDTSLGVSGYIDVISRIKEDLAILDPEDDCLAIGQINSLPSTGTWGDWNLITLLRYVHQINKMID